MASEKLKVGVRGSAEGSLAHSLQKLSKARQDGYALVDHPVSGLIRQSNRGADRFKPHRSKTALLEFFATAAGTPVVSPDAFERILKALAADTICLCLPLPALLVLIPLLGKAIPPRQLFDGVTENRVLVIVWTRGFTWALDPLSEILLEMLEPNDVARNFWSLIPSSAMALCQPAQTKFCA